MTKKDKILWGVLAGASLVIVLGIMFLLSAAEIVVIFPFMKSLDNVLVRYIIVILTMATGIMTFSNVCAHLSNIKVRNGLNIGITAFSTVLTVPLVYVFIAIFFAKAGKIGPVGKVMMLDRIVDGFVAWFGSGAFLYVVFVFMLILSIVFITVPIVSCIQVLKKSKAEATKTEPAKAE